MTSGRVRRWVLASLGVMSVALGALGTIVPGLPTTVFLIIACWCFARSCPWLEERLIRIPLFRPFLRYLEPGATMPRAARVTVTLIIGVCAGTSVALLAAAMLSPWLVMSVSAAGAVGIWCVWRLVP
jgi:uncharacterized membrane protein YbaN (DUF454 family)